jgi:hypothetical protein
LINTTEQQFSDDYLKLTGAILKTSSSPSPSLFPFLSVEFLTSFVTVRDFLASLSSSSESSEDTSAFDLALSSLEDFGPAFLAELGPGFLEELGPAFDDEDRSFTVTLSPSARSPA